MSEIYHSKISAIGKFAEETLASGILITFKHGVPSDLFDYCFMHQHGELKKPMEKGQWLSIGSNKYQITAVGEVASQNMKELGHISIRFDGSDKAELLGSIHVSGLAPVKVSIGDEIIISLDEKK